METNTEFFIISLKYEFVDSEGQSGLVLRRVCRR